MQEGMLCANQRIGVRVHGPAPHDECVDESPLEAVLYGGCRGRRRGAWGVRLGQGLGDLLGRGLPRLPTSASEAEPATHPTRLAGRRLARRVGVAQAA
eukprot:2984899-Prymnesium_polylepis.1